MDGLTLLHQGPKLTIQLLAALEAKIGRPVPPSYLRFLQAHNGGVPSRRGFVVPDTGDEDILDFFLGVGHSDRGMDMLRYLDKLSNYVTHGIWPIGCTAGASIVAIDSVRSESVVYLDIADPLDADGHKRGHWLASDVWEFCKQLRA